MENIIPAHPVGSKYWKHLQPRDFAIMDSRMKDNRWARLLAYVTGLVNQRLLLQNEYLIAENRLLRERLGGRRIIFTDAERRNLAEKAKAVGRKTLRELGTIVTPETFLRWHRELVAWKWAMPS